MSYDLLPEDTIVPTTEYPITVRSPSREYSREEREKKKKKRKKRSRSRSPPSPKTYYESKSRSHSKVKHSLPTAYRTVRRSRYALAPTFANCCSHYTIFSNCSKSPELFIMCILIKDTASMIYFFFFTQHTKNAQV